MPDPAPSGPPAAGAPGPAGGAALPRGYARGEGRQTVQRPVWVDLEALFGDPGVGGGAGDGTPPVVPDGLDLHGEVHGLLHYWARGSDGRWLAVVSFRVPYRPENRSSPGLEVRWVPVPAVTVRPASNADR